MVTAADDPYGLPTYSRDLALKPDLTFVQLSDSQLDDGSNAKRAARYAAAERMNGAAVAEVNRLNAAFVFMTGDLVNKDTVAEWRTFNDIYSGLTAPLYTLPGNHDLLYAGTDDGRIHVSENAGESWRAAGSLPDVPEGFFGAL